MIPSSGIINWLFFASVMSFMGMAMNAAESGIIEGQVNNILEYEIQAPASDILESGANDVDKGGDMGSEVMNLGVFGMFYQ